MKHSRTKLFKNHLQQTFFAVLILPCLFLLANPTIGFSEEEDSEDIIVEPEYMSFQSCSAIFGDGDDIEQNKKQRTKLVTSFDGKKGLYTLVHHSNKWSQPVKLHIPGFKIIKLVPRSKQNKKPYALVELESDLAEDQDCDAGVYRINLDNRILEDMKILGIDDELLLMSYKGKLGLLQQKRSQLITVRLIWQSPWQIDKVEGGTSSSSSGSSKSKKRKKKKKRNRHRKK